MDVVIVTKDQELFQFARNLRCRGPFIVRYELDVEKVSKLVLKSEDVIVLDHEIGRQDVVNHVVNMRNEKRPARALIHVLPRYEIVDPSFAQPHDQFLVMPFGTFDFIERLKSMGLSQRTTDTTQSLELLEYRQAVIVDDNEVALTPNEFKLIGHLIESRGKPVSYEQISQLIWGCDAVKKSTFASFLSKLREKLNLAPSQFESAGHRSVILR